MSETAVAPLNEPSYEPKHPPVGGGIPDVVAKWGPRSQLRWFRRFSQELGVRRDWDAYYYCSPHHRGACCYSCADEAQHGLGAQLDGWCCCRDERTRR